VNCNFRYRGIVEKDCRARGLNMEDAMYRSRWRKQIGMIDDHDECEWVNNVRLYINSQQTINTTVNIHTAFVSVSLIWRFLTEIWQ